MTNKDGLILGTVSAIIYVLIINSGQSGMNFATVLGTFILVLAIPAVIAFIISLFMKGKFGKIFGITCVILHAISAFGFLSM